MRVHGVEAWVEGFFLSVNPCLFVNLLNFSTRLGARVCVKGFMFSHISDFVPPSYKSRRLGGHGIKTDWANWGLSGSWVIHQGFRLFRLCGLTVPSLRLNVGAHS